VRSVSPDDRRAFARGVIVGDRRRKVVPDCASSVKKKRRAELSRLRSTTASRSLKAPSRSDRDELREMPRSAMVTRRAGSSRHCDRVVRDDDEARVGSSAYIVEAGRQKRSYCVVERRVDLVPAPQIGSPGCEKHAKMRPPWR